MNNTLLHEMQRYQKKYGKFWLHYFYKFYGIRWLDANIGTERIAECLYKMGYDRMKVWRMEETFKRIAYCLENGADLEVIQQIARIANSWWFWDTSMREVENGLDSD